MTVCLERLMAQLNSHNLQYISLCFVESIVGMKLWLWNDENKNAPYLFHMELFENDDDFLQEFLTKIFD